MASESLVALKKGSDINRLALYKGHLDSCVENENGLMAKTEGWTIGQETMAMVALRHGPRPW